MLVGGNGPRVLDRVLRYGDEWFPNRLPDGVEGLKERIDELRERAGRHVPVVVLRRQARGAGGRAPGAGRASTACIFYVSPNADRRARSSRQLDGFAALR